MNTNRKVPSISDVEDECEQDEVPGQQSSVTAMLVGDLHYQPANLAHEAKPFTEKCIALVKKTAPDFVVLLGDLLHTHGDIKVMAFNEVCRFIEGLSKMTKVFVLIGNHDYYNNSQFLTENHPFCPLKKWHNVVIVDNPIRYELGLHSFVFCPYVPNGKFVEALDMKCEKWSEADAIFAHQEFKGCKMGAIVSETGDVWEEKWPYVYSGHIHETQTVGKVRYIGSAMQHGYGDTTDKRIWKVVFSDGNHKITKIDLKLRQKKILHLPFENLEKKLKDIDGLLETHDLKLVLSAEPEQFATFKKSALYNSLVKGGIKFSFAPVVSESKSHRKSSSGEKKVVCFEDVFESLVKNSNSDVQKAYVSLMKELKV